MFLPWKIERHDTVESTNQLAAARILACWKENNSPAGIVITANIQTAGKGQHGRAWQSPLGGIYLSAIIDEIPHNVRDKLALIAGVTVAKTLRHAVNTEVLLRWPNDLIYKGRKLGGILCEAISSGDQWAAIIGVGLNINTHLEKLPTALQRTATSLITHHKRRCDIGDIEHSLLGEFSSMLTTLRHEGAAPFIHRAQQLDELRGKSLTFHDGTRLHIGIASGIGENGELLVKVDGHNLVLTNATLLSIDGQPLRHNFADPLALSLTPPKHLPILWFS